MKNCPRLWRFYQSGKILPFLVTLDPTIFFGMKGCENYRNLFSEKNKWSCCGQKQKEKKLPIMANLANTLQLERYFCEKTHRCLKFYFKLNLTSVANLINASWSQITIKSSIVLFLCKKTDKMLKLCFTCNLMMEHTLSIFQ